MMNFVNEESVYIKLSLHDEPKIHPFYSCTLSLFGEQGHRTRATFQFIQEKNILIVEPSNGVNSLPFEHAMRCPVRELSKDNIKLQQDTSTVKIGVSVRIENSKGHVLITRRAKHMRTFPHSWVLPGGHIEKGESLENAATREILEETGIQIKENQISTLALYESCFPVYLETGMPTRHHIVVYFRCKVEESTEMPHLVLQKEEVDAASWVSASTIREALLGSESNNTFEVLVSKEERLETVLFKVKQLQAIIDEKGKLPDERLSTGTRFALREWLSSLSKF